MAAAAALAGRLGKIVISSWNISGSTGKGQEKAFLVVSPVGISSSSKAGCNAFAGAGYLGGSSQAILEVEEQSSCRMAEARGPDTSCGKISGKLLRWKILIFTVEYLQPPESLILIQFS